MIYLRCCLIARHIKGLEENILSVTGLENACHSLFQMYKQSYRALYYES